MKKVTKPTIGKLVEEIEKAQGNISQVARRYNRPRSTVQGWIESSPTALAALEDAREARVDDAETAVYNAMEADNVQAAFYVLNNHPHARRRGWGIRQTDITSGGQPITRIIEERNAD